ncbi:MAG: T9SS type A sorting domain-containing protein [Flavobacteriales bacterium]|nr:T9SS type A sorting domain-containing protein [Flavobacteriales bacterium]
MKYILILILIFPLIGISQQHNYSYDASGNRIKREYVVLPPANNPFRQKAPNDTTQVSLEIKAYPNPFSDEVRIDIITEEELTGSEQLHLYSETGQLIQQFNIKQHSKILNTSKLANGKYILRLFFKEESTEFILIKN